MASSDASVMGDMIAEEFTYGDTVEHEWIRVRMGLPERLTLISQQRVYGFFVEEVREHMLYTHRMDLVNVRGEGYLIIHPSKQADAAHDESLGDAMKALRKGIKRAENVNNNMLTDEQRVMATNTAANLRAYAHLLRERARKRDNWK